MPNQHSTKPKAVRMPDGLEARVKAAAEADGETVNAFIVAAIEERLERRGGSTVRTVPAMSGSTTRKAAPKRSAVKDGPEGASDIAAYFRNRNGGHQ